MLLVIKLSYNDNDNGLGLKPIISAGFQSGIIPKIFEFLEFIFEYIL